MWAYAVLVAATVNVVLAIPRSGSWLYYLVIAVYFAILLPVWPAARVGAASLVALVVGEGLAAGTAAPQVLTAALGVAMVAMVAHATGDMIVRVVGQSERRVRMLATVAQSARPVASLDPDEVPRRVADAAIPLGPMIRDAVQQRAPVVRHDYLQGERPNPQLREQGIDAVVVSPVVVEDEVRAVLVGGRQASHLDPAQTEAFARLGELLAQSLANARRFEREREAVATLDELGRLKDDFISNVSHELRTPITVIMGGLQTLDRRAGDLSPAMRERLFRSALANAEVLQATLESLLEFARAEQGRTTQQEVHPVDVAGVVHACVERLDGLLLDHPVQVEAAQTAVAEVAMNQLDRVVDNLLLNAARHTPAGTRVQVRVEPADDAVRVEVTDEGPGIDPVDLPHLTDRFFRGGESTTRATRGLGLGLALAQSILVAHGSHLQVDSRPGEGTRFWFDLPGGPGAPRGRHG